MFKPAFNRAKCWWWEDGDIFILMILGLSGSKVWVEGRCHFSHSVDFFLFAEKHKHVYLPVCSQKNTMIICHQQEIIFAERRLARRSIYWSHNPSCFQCLRDRVPGVSGGPLLRAVHHRVAHISGGHLRLQESLDQHCRLLVLLSRLDRATFAWMEQLRAGGSRHHMFGPVAPSLPSQHLLRAVSLHLLPAAATSADGLLLRPHPDCYQEGELRVDVMLNLEFFNFIKMYE